MPRTVGELTQQSGTHQPGSVRRWAVAQVEEWFEVRVRLGFGQLEALSRCWGKQPPVAVAASCWLMLQVCSRLKRSKRSSSES